jgi:hypothetical protein
MRLFWGRLVSCTSEFIACSSRIEGRLADPSIFLQPRDNCATVDGGGEVAAGQKRIYGRIDLRPVSAV